MRRAEDARRRRWGLLYRQFDLTRSADQQIYLTRFWIVDTPVGGICLHKMLAPDARSTLHDHPFDFVAFVLRGGYVERRLRPTVMRVEERHRVRWTNRIRAGVDAHAITELLRVPTWTLLFAGRKRRAWGFWEPSSTVTDASQVPAVVATPVWRWTDASSFDSGVVVPLPDGTR